MFAGVGAERCHERRRLKSGQRIILATQHSQLNCTCELIVYLTISLDMKKLGH